MQHHPDKNPQNPQAAADKMTAINSAYEKLSEISKRRERRERSGEEDLGGSTRRTQARAPGQGKKSTSAA